MNQTRTGMRLMMRTEARKSTSLRAELRASTQGLALSHVPHPGEQGRHENAAAHCSFAFKPS